MQSLHEKIIKGNPTLDMARQKVIQRIQYH